MTRIRGGRNEVCELRGEAEEGERQARVKLSARRFPQLPPRPTWTIPRVPPLLCSWRVEFRVEGSRCVENSSLVVVVWAGGWENGVSKVGGEGQEQE